MKRFKKPIVAKNPLSENIAKRLHYEKRSNAGFKAEIEQIVGITKKSGDSISDQTILSWITADKKDPRFPSKNPKPESLEKLATAMNLDSLWDFYVDQNRWKSKECPDNILPEQKIVIDKILKIIHKHQLRELIRYVDYILQIGDIEEIEDNNDDNNGDNNNSDESNIQDNKELNY